MIASISGTETADLGENARLDEDLHLDSLGRVQLQSALEQQLGITVSDEALLGAQTLQELRQITGLTAVESSNSPLGGTEARPVVGSTPAAAQPNRKFVYPRWPWSWPVRVLRVVFVEAILRPLVALLAAPAVRRELKTAPSRPLLIVANHVTSFDAPLVLYALPGEMRRRVAIAMSGEMLDDWRHARNQGAWWLNLLAPFAYWLVTALFNVFPLPRSAGFRRSFSHVGEALDRGYHVLVFPEGHRSADGSLQPFRSGIGLLAKESGAAILPVALLGLGAAKQGKEPWFRSGRLAVHVGDTVTFDAQQTPEQIAQALHDRIASLMRAP